MSSKRVIVLVDMDCFYVQVEKKLHPELKGKPCAVVQYKKWQGGSIIAVDYEARKYGVSRLIKGNEAKKLCPEIQLARIPEKRGKANLTNYRKASVEVMSVLSRFSSCIEKASVDEAFLDITAVVERRIQDMEFGSVECHCLPGTHIAGSDPILSNKLEVENEDNSSHVVAETVEEKLLKSSEDTENAAAGEGSSNMATIKNKLEAEEKEENRIMKLTEWLNREGKSEELVLAVGALVALEIRQAVYDETSFTCSAGISYNKMLAKLAAGMNKPNQQTILPLSRVPSVYCCTPFRKIRHLGGKFGETVKRTLGLEFVGELREYSLKSLQEKFGNKQGLWLYEICQGIDHEPIRTRTITQSIGCGKNFLGPEKLKTAQQVMHWLEELSSEVVERLEEDLEENSRRARSISVSISIDESPFLSSLTRSFPVDHYDSNLIAGNAWVAINKGHCIAGRVDPDGHTPLKWTSGIRNIHITAGKFAHCSSRQASSSKLDSFVTTTRATVNSTDLTENKDEDYQLNTPKSSPLKLQDDLLLQKKSRSMTSTSSHKQLLLTDITDYFKPSSSQSAETGRTADRTPQNRHHLRSTAFKNKDGGVSLTNYFSPLKRARLSDESVVPVPAKRHIPISNSTQLNNKFTGEDHSPSSEDNCTMCICAKCGEEILGLNYPGHLDYHYALELQESFNSE